MRKVRVAAKALILRDEHILLLKCMQEGELYYCLPGGGQEHGERIDEALVRECQEEIGAEIQVQELTFVRDYISKNHQFRESDPHFHQVELIFRCELIYPENPQGGHGPDDHQIGVEWISFSQISEIALYPEELKNHLPIPPPEYRTVYLGDIN